MSVLEGQDDVTQKFISVLGDSHFAFDDRHRDLTVVSEASLHCDGSCNITKTLTAVGFFISDSRRHDNPDKTWRHSNSPRQMTFSRHHHFPHNLNTQNYAAKEYHIQTGL